MFPTHRNGLFNDESNRRFVSSGNVVSVSYLLAQQSHLIVAATITHYYTCRNDIFFVGL